MAVSNLQNITILSPESGSAPSNWHRSLRARVFARMVLRFNLEDDFAVFRSNVMIMMTSYNKKG